MKRALMPCLVLLAACGGPLYDGSGQQSPNHGCDASGCPTQLLAEGQSPPAGGLVVTPRWLVWADASGPVTALATDGSPPVQTVGSGADALGVDSNGNLLWPSFNQNLVYEYDATSGTARAISNLAANGTDGMGPPPFTVHATRAYWFDHLSLVEKDTLTHATRQVATADTTPLAVAADDGYAYWSEWGDDTGSVLKRVDLASGVVTVLASGLSFPERLVVDADAVYALLNTGDARQGGSIVRVPKPGGEVMTLATARFFTGEDLAVDDAYVYFTNANLSGPVGNMSVYEGLVERIPKAGGVEQWLAHGQLRPGAIAVDASVVYWASFDGKIQRLLKP